MIARSRRNRNLSKGGVGGASRDQSQRSFGVHGWRAGPSSAGAGWPHGSTSKSRSGHPTSPPRRTLALTPDGKLLDTDFPDPFAGGEFLGYLPFVGEGERDPTVAGSCESREGHNARRIIDLASLLTPQGRTTPADRFYHSHGISRSASAPPEWTIKIHGEVKQPKAVPLKATASGRRSEGRRCCSSVRETRGSCGLAC